MGCVKDYDRASDIGYFVAPSTTGNPNSFIRLYAVDPPATSGSVKNLTVNNYDSPPDSVDTPGDDDFEPNPDMKNSILRNGHLWTAHAIGDGDDSNIRWYEIDLDDWPDMGSSPSVLQTGTIDMEEGTSVMFPAIGVDDNGNMAIAWMQCSSTEEISIYRAIPSA